MTRKGEEFNGFYPVYEHPEPTDKEMLDLPDYFECVTCGVRVERGILSMSGHWAKCTGKNFTEALLKTRNDKNSPLTIEDIDNLRKTHLND